MRQRSAAHHHRSKLYLFFLVVPVPSISCRHMNWKDHLLTGLVCGMLSPPFAFAVYAKIKFSGKNVSEIFSHVQQPGILSTMISLCVFINLLVFFIFIWRKYDRSARGVL